MPREVPNPREISIISCSLSAFSWFGSGILSHIHIPWAGIRGASSWEQEQPGVLRALPWEGSSGLFGVILDGNTPGKWEEEGFFSMCASQLNSRPAQRRSVLPAESSLRSHLSLRDIHLLWILRRKTSPAPSAINATGGSDPGFFYGMDFGAVLAALPQLRGCARSSPWGLGFGVGVRMMLGMVCVPSVGTDVVQPLGQWRVPPAGLERGNPAAP